MTGCDPHADRCITCGDDGVAMRVVGVEGAGLMLCVDGEGQQRTVDVGLVEPVDVGDAVLVHADVALVRL
jgi:hydrogenase maturation factor